MFTRSRKLLLWLLLIPTALVVAVTGFVIFNALRPLPPVPPLPADNGHADFVTASQIVTAHTGDYSKLNKEDLRALVAKDSAALKLARTGLEKQCRIPLDFSTTSTTHLDELARMKRLALAFAAEGRLAEMEGRYDEASKSYLDAIHFGTESVRGGTVLDQMVGTAIEAIGIAQLQKLAEHLDAKACRETAAALDSLDTNRQSWEDVLQQEEAWSRRAFRGPRYVLARLLTGRMIKEGLERTEQKSNEQQLRARQLLIEIATRAYELEKGRRPASLSDLMPDYLKAIPQNPLTGANMNYSP